MPDDIGFEEWQTEINSILESAPSPKYRSWEKWEEAILRKWYGKVEVAIIAKVLKRTKTAVIAKYSRL
jgi:predicted GNAT family acetyltransferase